MSDAATASSHAQNVQSAGSARSAADSSDPPRVPARADTASGPVHHSPAPLALWVLVGFLVADAILRAADVGHALVTGSASEGTIAWRTTRGLAGAVTVVFNLLLALQLLLRLAQARVWGTAYFLLQVAWFIAVYIIRNPDAWQASTTLERMQVLLRLLFFTVNAVLIHCPPLSTVLRR